MKPHDFIAKWRGVELKQRSASQSHFNDLCALVGIPDPISADPKGEWFAFEKGAGKTTGGEGWADVWRRECFAWEYKGPKKDLDRAFAQLQQYAVALENPPLLIVSDMTRFRIHTNWTNTVQEVHAFDIEDLADGATRDLLAAAFLDPERLRPRKTRQRLTEEAAGRFAAVAQQLREGGHGAETVAHFINRLVFCMFAEDVGLLPGHMFRRMLEQCQANPADFEGHARTLFGAMRSGGMVGFERVSWFNGGLFDDDQALALDRTDLSNLLETAPLDWSDIDPSILDTLFAAALVHELIEAADDRRLQRIPCSAGAPRHRRAGLRPALEDRRGADLRGHLAALRTRLDHRHHEPALRRMDRGLRIRAPHRSHTRPAHPPRPHP